MLADLDDAARLHHGDAIGDLGDHAEIMGDEQHGMPVLVAQLAHELEHLRLRRHVERRGRLVGDEEGRAHGERHGDDDALALPTRKLVRIGGGDAIGIREPRVGEQGLRPEAPLAEA